MSNKHTLILTNGYANYGKIEDTELIIKGDCKITNYDPGTNEGANAVKKGSITINFSDEAQTIETGTGRSSKSAEKADFSKKKYSIFKKIAALDGNEQELSINDIKKMDKSLIQEWGLTDLRLDYKNGVATLIWKKGDILRIDFKTWKEKIFGEYKTQDTTEQTSKAKTKSSDNTVSTGKGEKIKQKTPRKTDTSNTISKSSNLDNDVDYSGVKKEWIPYIQNLAKESGYSEDLIISLVLNENYTPIAVYKPENGGLIEGGFGHTNKAKSNNNFEEGDEIDLKTAFEWLGQDIKDCEDAIKEFGSYYDYDNLPRSMQDAIIDIAFNRGISKLNPNLPYFDTNYRSLHANIKAGYIGSAAVRLRQEKFSNPKVEAGLRKRNVIRFLNAINDLEPDKIIKAMNLFNRDGYYTKALNMAKGAEYTKLKETWDTTYNRAKAACV